MLALTLVTLYTSLPPRVAVLARGGPALHTNG